MSRKPFILGAAALVVIAGVGAMGTAVTGDEPASTPTPTRMPAIDDPPGMLCAQQYPDGLGELPIAFDGTILSQGRSSDVRSAQAERNAAPVDVVLRVNEVYRGEVGPTVRMRTWDFDTSASEEDRAGDRYLIASTESLDAMYCGFTRPWNEQDAEYWTSVFQS